MPSDTTPEAERVWIGIWRRLTPERRLRRAREVSSRAIRMSRQALRRARPDLTDRQIDLWWVELHYGRSLAAGLRDHLERHDPSER